MKFAVIGKSRMGITDLRISHGDEHIEYPVQGYNNASIYDPDNLFYDINLYLSTLSQESQKEIFNLYKKGADIINEFNDIGKLISDLRSVVIKIMNHINIEDVRTQIVNKPGLVIPDTINREYTADNLTMENYSSRTYLVDGYYDLATLGVLWRLMIPFCGWVMTLIKKEVGNKFKEEYVTAITVGTQIDKFRGTKQLRDFVYTNTGSGNDDLPIASIMGGMAAEVCSDHLTALATVRKLAIEPIDNKHNLVVIIYNYVTGTKSRIETRFRGNIRLKPVSNSDRSDDDNSAVTDAWKLTERISDGTKTPYLVYCKDVDKVMRHLTRTPEHPEGHYNKDLLNKCMSNYKNMLTADMYPHQTALIMWVCTAKRRTMTAPAITILDKAAKLTLALATQARLWEWGFNELAALMTVTTPPPDYPMTYPNHEPRKRIPSELRPVLNDLYPYYRTEQGRSDINDDPEKRPNEAGRAIELIFGEISNEVWMLHGPKELNDTLPTYAGIGPYRASGNIRVELANLILKINERD